MSQKSFAEGGGEIDNSPSSAPSGALSSVKELSRTMGLWDLVGGVIGVLEEQGDAEKIGKCISKGSSVSSARVSEDTDKSRLIW